MNPINKNRRRLTIALGVAGATVSSIGAIVKIAWSPKRESWGGSLNNRAYLTDELHELSATLLPSELSNDEIDDATSAFIQWVFNHKPNIEIAQYKGFKYTKGKKTREGILELFTSQLDKLNRDAIRLHKVKLSKLELTAQQSILNEDLAHQLDDGNEHVLLRFLDHFYSSDAGINLRYRTELSPSACRGWQTNISSQKLRE